MSQTIFTKHFKVFSIKIEPKTIIEIEYLFAFYINLPFLQANAVFRKENN